MRVSSPLSVLSRGREAPWMLQRAKMPRPTPLPTIHPTRTSYLQRLLWLFTPER